MHLDARATWGSTLWVSGRAKAWKGGPRKPGVYVREKAEDQSPGFATKSVGFSFGHLFPSSVSKFVVPAQSPAAYMLGETLRGEALTLEALGEWNGRAVVYKAEHVEGVGALAVKGDKVSFVDLNDNTCGSSLGSIEFVAEALYAETPFDEKRTQDYIARYMS